MRAKVQHHLLLPTAENHRVGESGETRHNLDGTSAGIVEHTPLEGPAVGVPDPVRDWAVDDGGPAEDEDHGRHQATSLGEGAHDDSRRDCDELHLTHKPSAQ